MKDVLLSEQKPRFYLLVGDEDNWKVSAKMGLWGFTEQSKGLWNTTVPGELLAYYVTKPTQKIIGFGQVEEKYIDEKLIWSDEKLFKRSLWKYKLKIKNFHVCDDWDDGLQITDNMILRSSRTIMDGKLFWKYVKLADKKWQSHIFNFLNSKNNSS